jgi:hypothetical protein
MRLKLASSCARECSDGAGSGRQNGGSVMADFRVLFFNNLVNSYGKPFKCLQRAITVSSAKDAGEASEKAKHEFERLENVPIGNATLNS